MKTVELFSGSGSFSRYAKKIGWETYQGFHYRKHGGFSIQDLQYNVAGIMIGYLQKKSWFYFKKTRFNKDSCERF